MPSGVYVRTDECNRIHREAWLLKTKQKVSGENSYMWVGDKIGYRGIHHWIKKTLGSPMQCTRCGYTSENPKKIHWANISHEYKRIVEDWIRLCAKCHKAYDMGKINLTQNRG